MKAGCAPGCCRTTISPAYIAKCSMNKVHRQLRCAAVRAGQQLHLHVQCTAELHQRHLPARVGTFSKPATSSGNLDFRFQNCCGWPAAHQCHSTSLQCHGPRPDGLPRYKLCLDSRLSRCLLAPMHRLPAEQGGCFTHSRMERKQCLSLGEGRQH